VASTEHAIVVDASVARAAGGPAAVDPTSVLCRQSLAALRDADHKVVMSRPIQIEWSRHRSRFAFTWLTDMQSRRRVLRLNNPINNELRAQIKHVVAPNAIDRVLKDVPLVEAALASEQRILSLNERERKHFQIAVRHPNPESWVTALGDIIWVNPGLPREGAPHWLFAGAPDEPHRCLGYTGQSS